MGAHMKTIAQADDRSEYVSAAKATELLGIKPQTLYAYVARGWVRALSQAGTRQKRYALSDIERLRARSEARAGHGPAAAAALRWGEPVINSSITELTPHGPRYRGMLAVDLARKECAFEATADFLWSGLWNEGTRYWNPLPVPETFLRLVHDYTVGVESAALHGKLAVLTQLLSDTQEGNAEAELGSAAAAGRQILHVLAGAFGMLRQAPFIEVRPGESIASLILRALDVRPQSWHEDALNMALTLAADHELALPTFAARAVASSGSDLNACVVTGLVSFNGPLTTGEGQTLEHMVAASPSKNSLKEQIANACRQGRQMAEFNHPLYPHGDPRARFLLDYLKTRAHLPDKAQRLLEALDESVAELDVALSFPAGLTALQVALGLPARSGGALYLLGRVAGLVAHVQEQRLAGFFIRPRAKYVVS